MTAPELKPCPFCGAVDPEWLASHVVCDCGATGPRQDVDREYQADAMRALTDWNRRADLAAVQPAQVRVKPLVWSDRFGPNSECSYDHITADSALGLYRVEWKGWKDFDPPTVCCGGAFIGCYNTIQSAKAAAQADYEARILAALEPQPDPRDEVIARLVEAVERQDMVRVCTTSGGPNHDGQRWVHMLDYNDLKARATALCAALAAAKAVQHG